MKKIDQKTHNAFDWYSSFHDANLLFSFKGEFNKELVNAILAMTKKKENLGRESKMVRNRIFGIIVECLQNICKYGIGSEGDEKLKPGIILMGNTGDEYIISAGNIIKNNEIDPLREQLDLLNTLDEKGLKKLQSDVLKGSDMQKYSGSGIGLIFVARKSNDKLKYKFRKLNDQESFFSIEARVSTDLI